jgi:3-phytase
MKTPILNHTFALAAAGAALLVGSCTAHADVFELNVASDEFTLYEDPAGNKLKLGGSSGLIPVPGDTTGRLFYTVTDRGPNGDHPNLALFPTMKIFPAAYFSPSIIKIELTAAGTAEVLEIVPLKKPNGDPVTGWPNSCFSNSEDGRDLAFNVLDDPDGLDVEGITIDHQGNFWISDEYRPSICKVAPDGTVVLRLVPAGTVCGTEQIPTLGVLPSVYAKRRLNRGMEGVAYSHGYVYGIMQRPLGNPTAGLANSGRHIRMIGINVNDLSIRQHIYVTEANTSQQNVYASDICALNPALFLVPERRTDRIFAINIAPATDITPLEDSNGRLLADPTKTIEQLTPAQLNQFGINPVKKVLVHGSMIALDPVFEKCEGITTVGRTAVLISDNDFNFAGVDLSTTPASIFLFNPEVKVKVATTPIAEEIVFPE